MSKFEYEITYDSVIGCFVWWHDGSGMCLGAETLGEAQTEVLSLVDHGMYPETSMVDEYGTNDEYVPEADDRDLDHFDEEYVRDDEEYFNSMNDDIADYGLDRFDDIEHPDW